MATHGAAVSEHWLLHERRLLIVLTMLEGHSLLVGLSIVLIVLTNGPQRCGDRISFSCFRATVQLGHRRIGHV
jgi:hypothetical protein